MTRTPPAPQPGYAPVNGLQLDDERHGSRGRPLMGVTRIFGKKCTLVVCR